MDHTTLCFQISPDQLKTLTTTGRLNLDNKVLLLCEWGRNSVRAWQRTYVLRWGR